MTEFQPSLSFWPPPRFPGDSCNGLASWIARRDAASNVDASRHTEARSIKRIIEDYHDGHSRTLEHGGRDAQ